MQALRLYTEEKNVHAIDAPTLYVLIGFAATVIYVCRINRVI